MAKIISKLMEWNEQPSSTCAKRLSLFTDVMVFEIITGSVGVNSSYDVVFSREVLIKVKVSMEFGVNKIKSFYTIPYPIP